MELPSYLEVLDKLKESLGKRSYKHAINTAELAYELSERYKEQVFPKAAQLAALLHDCAKLYSYSQLANLIKEYNIKLDKIEKRERKLWHGPVGAFIAKEEYGVKDDDILHAIAIHSTGAPNMNHLDKIVYISDYIESSKKLPKQEEIKNIAKENLNLATILVINYKIAHLLDEHSIIHPKSILAYNQLVTQL